MSIRSLAPQAVWQWFADICAVPHPTYREAELAAYIMQRAEAAGIACRQDDKGNLYLHKPACGENMAGKRGVILQAHIDMVAQKTPDSPHNFMRDPIATHIDDGWVRAEQTTLGADNGIGAAMALAVLFADDIAHPPLDVLLTVEEEIGMGGARAVQADLLQGKYLINLDTEENGSIYLGCAGGRDADVSLPMQDERSHGEAWRVCVDGMTGGHSGIDIHRGRGNAIKLLADTLCRWSGDWQLVSFHGGTLRNVIPREAEAVLVLPAGSGARFAEMLAAAQHEAQTVFANPQLGIRAESVALPERAFSRADSRRAVDLLAALPDGALQMSRDFAGVVDTSICLSVAHTDENGLRIGLLMRSLSEAPKDALSRRLQAAARLAGAQLQLDGDYPGWTPNPHSPLFHATRAVFTQHFRCEPKVEVIHAGLECGLLQQRLPDVEMVSFGPTIEGAHSPKERVHIDSVRDCWDILLQLLKNTP